MKFSPRNQPVLRGAAGEVARTASTHHAGLQHWRAYLGSRQYLRPVKIETNQTPFYRT
jgi:hypothetical protein